MTLPKMKNKVGSSTFLNSCSFQRYRPLSPVKFGNFNDHPLFGIRIRSKITIRPNTAIDSMGDLGKDS